jgi:excisionase family DNA binding protein
MQTETPPNNTDQPLRGALQMKEAAHYLSVSPVTLRRLINRRLIFPNRTCRHLLFPIAELERFLNDPANTNRHYQLPPQNTATGSPWRKAVAASRWNKKGGRPPK